MPTFRITGPDGATYRITAPEGATDAEVMQRVQMMAAPAAPKQAGPTTKQRQQFADEAFNRDDMTLQFATPFGTVDTGVGIGRALPKALANLGAGFDTAWQGAKQLVGQGEGDAAIKEKRKADEALADVTTGGGLLQIAGEALPTMVIPAGGAARLAGAGLRGVGAARAANAIGGGTARLVADNALMGAVGGALGPVTSDESRLGNAAVGATFGAALPAAGSVVRAGYENFTRTGAANKVAREIRDAIIEAGGTEAQVRQALADYATEAASQGGAHIPLTSAAAAGDSGLARLEAGARARSGANFRQGDQLRAQRVQDAVLRDTAEAEQLAARRGQRAAEWDANWAQAQEAALPEVWAQRLPEFRQNLDIAMRSPEASNPAVRNVLNTVADEIDRLGEDFTPAHLQQIRANLNQRGSGQYHASPNAYQSAPRESAAVNSLLQEVDDVMNATTQGAWGGVLDAYATGSRAVDAAKAAGRVREKFYEPNTGRILGKTADDAGEVAKIAEAGLGTAITRGQGPDKVQRLAPQAQAGLAQTLEALRAQNIVQRVKDSATAGGGSNTASDQFAAKALEAMPGQNSGMWGAIVSGAKNFAQRRKDEAMVEALRNPQALQALLAQADRAPSTLTPKQQKIVDTLRSVAAELGGANKVLRQGGAVGVNDFLE